MADQITRYKNIVNKELGIDVNNPTRKRKYCEARGLYYTLLKNSTNLSLHSIGESVNKDHSTVVYSLTQFPLWLKHNNMLRYAYNNAKTKIKDLKDITEEDNHIKLKQKCVELNFEIFELKEQIKSYKEIEESRSIKNNRLIDLVNRIPEDKEDLIIDRLDKILAMY